MSLDSAITALVSRLETVTARLEKVEQQIASGAVTGGSSSSASAGGSAGGDGASAQSVQEYDSLVSQFINPYVELSGKLDPALKAQAQLVQQAVAAQRQFLAIAAASKKPDDATLQKLFGPTNDLISKISSLKDNRSKVANNLATVAEGISALGWVLVTPTPGPFVNDIRPGSEFYSNRILKEFKGVNQDQLDWVKHFNNFLKELPTYIKNFHTTGVAWNPRGGDASSAAGSSAPAPPAGGPPPPGPPPPPPAGSLTGPPSSAGKGADMTAVFSSLNKGEAITSGLKKVTNDMKTKNMTDRSSVVPAAAHKEGAGKTEKAPAKAKPSKFSLDGNKWVVENFTDKRDIVISETESRHTVYIFGLLNCTVQIKGKVNSVAVDNCKRTAVVLENAISGVEVVNGTSVEIQITGTAPSVAIDKTSGIQLYLSKESTNAEIVTSKSSEMNVLVPVEGQDDLVELPIPEQYKTWVKGGKLVTETVQHSG
eukprot:Phypoly_transcript_07637.p1 GENE.Phypoly_transcript_07637~~Phypoly_transcript_07637.p1  ORF type:complete len:506 (+),score=127.39 Phypoly_transcript_07637:71-1519(+)